MSDDPAENVERAFGWLMVTVISCALGLFGLVAWVIWRLIRVIVEG